MKTHDWLKAATTDLTAAGIGTARLDCLVLLEDVLRMDRSHILAMPDRMLSTDQLLKLSSLLKRRRTHEPLAYIRGKIEFYGREIKVDARVLQPRPETETMIELAQTLRLPLSPVVADIGTGSGCIALALKLERPKWELLATDIDPACLQVARLNAKKLKASIRFKRGDLLKPLKNAKLDVVLANLPYVPDNFRVNQAVHKEPKQAVFGGGDGLDLYRRFFEQLSKLKTPPAFVLTESLPPQHAELRDIAKQAGYKLTHTDDFIQIFTS